MYHMNICFNTFANYYKKTIFLSLLKILQNLFVYLFYKI